MVGCDVTAATFTGVAVGVAVVGDVDDADADAAAATDVCGAREFEIWGTVPSGTHAPILRMGDAEVPPMLAEAAEGVTE